MFSSFMRVLVNPVDALVFQPPTATYSTSVRGSLVPEANLVCVDRANGFYCVEIDPGEGTTNKPDVCIVWAHGNACDCGEESAAYLNIARTLNVSIVAAEFPGYGASPGIASEDGVDRAVQATYEYARSKPHVKTIIMVGRSVGTGPICRLARKLAQVPDNKLGALALWSAIVSIKDQCANLAGSVVSSFLGDRWSPIVDLQSVTCPVLFITGEYDSLTTPAMCERLRRACVRTNNVFVHLSELADHNQNWDFILDVIQPLARLLDHLDGTKGKQGDAEEHMDPVFAEGELPVPPSLPSAHGTMTMITPNDKADICIVGCGPVGLFVACNLIHRGVPGDRIVCVDKYATFQRSHVLRLERQSVENAPRSLVELIKGELGVTRTNVIEGKLAEECRSKNVAFMRPFEVKDVPDFVARFVPNAKMVVCCDGSHSVARKELFGGLDRRFTLEYVLDCRGEVVSKEKPSKLSLAQFVDLLGKITHIGEESVGRKTTSSGDEETWPVTFRLLITGEEMRSIRSSGKGTARNPLSVDAQEDIALLPPRVFESISKWRNTRARLFEGETISNLKCVAVDLNCYRARQYVAFAHEKCPNATFLLCGDSAFGVPFFRALNNGLLCASECARTVVDMQTNPSSVQSDTRSHLKYREGAMEEEDTERPREYKGMISRSFGASMASAGLGAQVSQILAHASFEQGVGMLLPESQDPARRYDDFVRRLARKEFAVAGSKRDGLEITKFANLMRNSAMQAVEASVSATSRFVSSSLTSSSGI